MDKSTIDESERIKDRLRRCSQASEVELVASQERENVASLGKLDGGSELEGQIKRLKWFMLAGFKFKNLKRRGG